LRDLIDYLQKNFQVTGEAADESLMAILVTMSIAVVCGAVIYCVYRFFYRGVVYSENENLLNLLVCLVTAFIIKTIGTNPVLSLGMVGALSIVRFRAAVKDPLDVGFLFWSVAAGLTAGAQLFGVALVCTLFIAIIFIIMSFTKFDYKNYLLIVKYPRASANAVNAELNKIKYKLKNKTVAGDVEEITIDLRLKKNKDSVVDTFGRINGVISCVLLEYSGDFAS